MALTRINALTLRYIEWHWWRYGTLPTQEELAEGFGVSLPTIQRRYEMLARDGYMQKISNRYVPLCILKEDKAA